jgi:hypothetical protein
MAVSMIGFCGSIRVQALYKECRAPIDPVEERRDARFRQALRFEVRNDEQQRSNHDSHCVPTRKIPGIVLRANQ